MHAVVGDVPEPHVPGEVRECPHHQMSVLDDVRNPGRGPRVVFEHAEHTLTVTHEVDAADADVCAVRKIEPLHLGAEVAVADDELGGHRAVVQDVLLVVDVVEEPIQCCDALNAATLDVRPIVTREDSRDHVEGQHPVDRIAVAVDGERDAEVVELAVARLCASLKRRDLHVAHPIADRVGVRGGVSAAAEHFAEESCAIVVGEKPFGTVGQRPSVRES